MVGKMENLGSIKETENDTEKIRTFLLSFAL